MSAPIGRGAARVDRLDGAAEERSLETVKVDGARDLAFTAEVNEFRGNRTVQLKVSDLRAA